jgi:hypothetical protein
MLTLLAMAALAPYASNAGTQAGFVSETGNLLTGKVVKSSGIERSGVITVKTTSSYPSIAPVYRYDFDMLYGVMDGAKYSYLMGDISEIRFLPPDEGPQKLEVMLRNKAVMPISLTSARSTMFGNVGLFIETVIIDTDEYGTNIIPVTDISKIVFDAPTESKKMDMAELVNRLGKTVEIGTREDLIDEELSIVLKKIHADMKERLSHGEK